MANLLKILLIENNRLDYYTFVHAMSKIECALMYGKVSSGKEALDKLNRCAILPDIILSDIDQPETGGASYLKKILRNPKTKDIPVVILSADIAKAGLIKKIGAKAFIKKPESCVKLKEKLEHVFQAGFITNKKYEYLSQV